MTRDELIDAVLERMERVWGEDGFGGEAEAYDWLQKIYGITEEDDVSWQLILQDSMDDLPEEELEDSELMSFLNYDDAVVQFLKTLLTKYQSASEIYSPHE